MKNLGDQAQYPLANSDPQNEAYAKRPGRVKTAIAAGSVALALGSTVAVETQPRVISGTAEVSADATRADAGVYIKSRERNQRLESAASHFTERVLQDLQEHPERTKFVLAKSGEGEENKSGFGTLQDVIEKDGVTYTFSVVTSGYGAIVNPGDPQIGLHQERVVEGKAQKTTILMRESKDQPWSAEKSVSPPTPDNMSAYSPSSTIAAREHTSAELQHAEQKMIEQGEQMLNDAGVSR